MSQKHSCTLVTPDVRFEESYRSYIRELGDAERYPFPLDFPHDDFPALIERLDAYSKGQGLAVGMVPNTTYWLLDSDEIVGVSNLRHRLTDKLRESGGHIGFGVRPSAKGRGVGRELLRRTLVEAGRLGIDEVLLICLKDNAASASVIAANGGQLQAEYSIRDYDSPLQRWVVPNESTCAQ